MLRPSGSSFCLRDIAMPQGAVARHVAFVLGCGAMMAALVPHALILLPVLALLAFPFLARHMNLASLGLCGLWLVATLAGFYLFAGWRGLGLGEPTLHITPALTCALMALGATVLCAWTRPLPQETARHLLVIFGFWLVVALASNQIALLVDALMPDETLAPFIHIEARKISGNVLCVLTMGFAAHLWHRQAILATLLLALCAFGAALASLSHAALVACSVMAGVFVLIRLVQGLVLPLVFTVYGLITLAAPWLMGALAHWFLQSSHAGINPSSFDARARIWLTVADAIPASWLTGHGINSVRARPFALPAEYGLELPRIHHAHNLPLALWHDTGALGIGLFLAVLFCLYRLLARLPAAARNAGLIMCTGAMSISLVEYSPWFEWIVAFWGLCALLAALMARSATPD